MSAKKVFNVNDKVFAKIRGYPAWPAIVSGVKADTPSRLRYNVYFYGTGERAECKTEELFPYEENKSKLGKPNKRKYFAEALLQIEDDGDSGASVLPEDDDTQSHTSNESLEIPIVESTDISDVGEKTNECNSESEGKLTIDETNTPKGKKTVVSRKSLGLSISKGTKRKISDIKPEAPSKKSMSNKQKSSDILKIKEGRPIVLVETLKSSLLERAIQKSEVANKNLNADEDISEATPDKHSETLNKNESELESSDVSLDNYKTQKSSSKSKDSPTSNSEISFGNNSKVGHVSRSGRKIKPKKYSDYENDAELPKRSRLSKDNSKSTEKHNNYSNESDNSSEQSHKTKDTISNPETKKTPKIHASASEPHINNSVAKELKQVNKKIDEDNELPGVLKDLMSGAITNIESGWKKVTPKKNAQIDLLHIEVELLDYIYNLRLTLRTDSPINYEKALQLLERIKELQLNTLMLKKHKEVVDTIKKVTKYIGNPSERNLSEQETIEHTEKATQIRRMAETVFTKFISLFTVPDGESFLEIYNKEVDDFFKKTKHMACDQIYGLTSEKLFK